MPFVPVDYDPFAKPAGAPAPAGSPLDRALAAEGLADDPVFAPLARSVYGQESSSGANARDSNRGAVGGMQVLPKTFLSVADKGWDIRNPDHNAQAGVRYLKQGYDQSGGDPKLAAAWYYGGPGGMTKARQGVAVSDPKNPGAPNTMQYADQVVGRMGAAAGVSGALGASQPSDGGQGAPKRAGSLVEAAWAAGGARRQQPVADAAPALPGAAQPAREGRFVPVDYDPFAEAPAGPGAVEQGLGRAGAALMGPAGPLLEIASPGATKALAGALGEGVGNIGLGLQHYLGKLTQGVGMDKAGQWLVDDAAAGRAKIEKEAAPLHESNPIVAGLGKFGGEVLATLPVGGVFGKAATTAAPMVSKVAPVVGQWLQKFGVALETSGFKTGAPAAPLRSLAGASNLATRSGAGSVVGGVTSGLSDSNEAGFGALAGGLLPGTVLGGGKAAEWVAGKVRQSLTPPMQRYAQQMAESLGMPVDDVLAALNAAQTGPSMIPGYQRTVPQIFQTPELSQLQRTVKNVGGQALGDAERVQQEQFRAALERLAPTGDTVADSALRTGTAIEDFAGNANTEIKEAIEKVGRNIDPALKSQIYLPQKEMAAARDTYLGPGTFGSGNDAEAALRKAAEVGTEVLPGVKPSRQAPPQTTAQAVRRAGGIRGKNGELRDLGPRESGTTGLVNNKSGNAADLLAEEMAARGYLDEADPDALVDALRGGLAGGKQRIPNDATDEALRGMFERGTMGTEGVASEVVDKMVPFRTMQNLRSSMLERARAAEALGNTRESAALNSMVFEIDKHLDNLASGQLRTGEYFPQEMSDQFRKMTDLKREQVARFETGPQYGMFRKGADGQPALQGAEIPGQFFNANRDQVPRMQSFKRMVGDDPALLTPEMKSYALTDAMRTANQSGDLTGAFGKWTRNRSGAIKELFDQGERATIGEVRKAVDRGMRAENLGRASGSNTAQNLAAMQDLGMLDSRFVDVVMNRIPVVKSFSAPLLAGLRETAKKTRNEALATLLSNPEEFAKALRAGQVPPDRSVQQALEVIEPLLLRGAPLALPSP